MLVVFRLLLQKEKRWCGYEVLDCLPKLLKVTERIGSSFLHDCGERLFAACQESGLMSAISAKTLIISTVQVNPKVLQGK
jgi:hypothetical protein